MKNLTRQPFWKPDVNILYDNRKCDYDNDGLDHVRQISRDFVNLTDFIDCGKIALLMKTVRDFHSGRKYEVLLDAQICADVRIFVNEQFAVNWIK